MDGCENDFMDIYMVMDCQCPISNIFPSKSFIFKYINLLILCQLIVTNSAKQCKAQVCIDELFIMNFRGMKRKSMKNKKFTK
jgi:hypothetical protein